MDVLEFEAGLTDRYQTTVPAAVRKALKVGKRDRIAYLVRSDGTVILRRAGADAHGDPALAAFLALLERDIAAQPRRLKPVAAVTKKRIDRLVGGLNVDLDAPLAAKR
jgi:antitoxin PrlF